MTREWNNSGLKLLGVLLLLVAASDPVFAAAPEAVAGIKAGKADCVGCDLRGADLSHQCVKTGNLTGARFDDARLVMMCMSYANFTNVSFRNADLAGANLAHAKLDGADFSGANLSITSFKGADLSRSKGLTQEQLDAACGDAETKTPAGLKARTCSYISASDTAITSPALLSQLARGFLLVVGL